ADTGDPRCDLVDCSVSADGDDERCAVLRSLSGELAEMPRLLGEESVALEAVGRQLPRKLRPAAARRPAGGRGVDQKDGPVAQWSCVTVTSASSVIWSTAARRSSSVIRLNSPSTTTSLTVSRQPVWIFFSAPRVNSCAASISTARIPRSDQRWYWPPSGL